jgi:hypothetical protein
MEGFMKVQELEAIAAMIEGSAEGLQFVVGVMKLVGAAVDEAVRVRAAAKKGKTPLDWYEFREDLRKSDQVLADLLESVDLKRFDFGRLNIAARDSITLNQLCLLKDRLRSTLAETYGADFRVRILDPEA